MSAEVPATSDAQAPRRDGAGRRKRRIVTALVFVGVLAVVDVLLCFALQPYGEHTELMWREYRQTPEIDTILVGTSTTAYGLKPQVLDENLGSRSFNMSTPGQIIDNVLATVETACADHQIKRVFMCVGYETLLEDPYINLSTVFTQAKIQGEPPAQALSDIGRLLGYRYFFERHESLTGLFPWAYDHVPLSPSNVADNIKNRMECDVFEAGERWCARYSPKWSYEGQGYGGYHIGLKAEAKHGDIVGHYGADKPVSPYSLDAFKSMCAFCKQQGVRLYVLGALYTPSAVEAYESHYIERMQALKEIVEAQGGTYLDLNMLHRSELDPAVDFFWDHVHLTDKGAIETSKAVSRLVKRIEAGEDVSGLFYSYDQADWDAYRASIDFVDSLDYTHEVTQEGARIEAQARTGTQTPVAYQLEVKDDSGQWRVAQAFGSASEFTLPRDGRDATTIRITARATNGHQDQDRSVVGTVSFT